MVEPIDQILDGVVVITEAELLQGVKRPLPNQVEYLQFLKSRIELVYQSTLDEVDSPNKLFAFGGEDER